MKHYLVQLHLQLGEYEKYTSVVVVADSVDGVGKVALIGECHNTPDFSDYPDNDACWDGGDFIYSVESIAELNKAEISTLPKFGIHCLYK